MTLRWKRIIYISLKLSESEHQTGKIRSFREHKPNYDVTCKIYERPTQFHGESTKKKWARKH